ncbi:MAG: hypothetical protein JSW48_11000 [Betaproteobacteria bacterium]|nr:MAG: hypothetical protein JSW48_11000 [Betaproteobacteria bacterium]
MGDWHRGDRGLAAVAGRERAHRGSGHFLNYTWQARRIIERVGASNLLLHPDSCHTPMLKGNLADTIRENAVIIGRFQIAGLPGRHERVNNRETCVILAL